MSDVRVHGHWRSVYTCKRTFWGSEEYNHNFTWLCTYISYDIHIICNACQFTIKLQTCMYLRMPLVSIYYSYHEHLKICSIPIYKVQCVHTLDMYVHVKKYEHCTYLSISYTYMYMYICIQVYCMCMHVSSDFMNIHVYIYKYIT